MITKAQAEYAEQRYGVKLPTWLDANDMAPGIPALARAVAGSLQRGMRLRRTAAVLLKEHQRLIVDAAALLDGRKITENLDEPRSLAGALRALADHEELLAPLVQALYEATDEPHP